LNRAKVIQGVWGRPFHFPDVAKLKKSAAMLKRVDGAYIIAQDR
jgi:hypothetical protein